MVDPGGVREKHAVRTKDPTSTRTPSMLSAIVDSIPRAVAVLDPLPGRCDDLTSNAQLAPLPFHDHLATIGADGAVLPVRRSSRARTPSVRLMLLPEAPARSIVPCATSIHRRNYERSRRRWRRIRGRCLVRCRFRVPDHNRVLRTRQLPNSSRTYPVPRGEESTRSAEPTKTTVIEGTIRLLQDVPRLVGMQKADPFLNKVRQALFGQGK